MGNITKRYTDDELKNAVQESKSYAEVCRKLGIVDRGGNLNTIKRRVHLMNLDISHFTGRSWNKGLTFIEVPRLHHRDIWDMLKENSRTTSHYLRNRILKEGIKPWKCECCNNTTWNEQPIPLELHHINGVHTDNRLENLQLICPNCHQQTDNYCSKNNRTKGKDKIIYITKEEPRQHVSKPKIKVISICKNCGKEYMQTHKDQLYCSPECYGISCRRVNITKDDIIQAYKKYSNFTAVARHYGISRTSIVKWCKKYDIPYKRESMDIYIKTE